MLARRLTPLFALLAIACAPMEGPPGAPGPVDGEARLEVVGSADVQTSAGTELEIGFRYIDEDGVTVEGEMIDFSLSPAGSTLAAGSAPTDAEGIAYAMVRAESEGSYDLVAEAAGAAPAHVNVTVRPMVTGTLDVEVSYMGPRPVVDAELAIFTNASCEDLARAVPSPAAVANANLGDYATFDGLALDVPMAVYVLGIDGNDNVAAQKCISHTMTEEAEVLRAVLADTEMGLGGPYATVETFDVTDGFSNDLDTVLHVAGGLGSDDPALWLVNEVRNHSGTPSWIRSALGSSFTRQLAADLLRQGLEDIHTPTELNEMVRFGADVNSAFTGLTLEGELGFDRPDEYGVAMGTHRITQLVVPLSDGEARTPQNQSAEVVVTFGDRIEMDEHQFALSFGELVEIILSQSILNRLSSSPATVGELIEQQFDCSAIAARIGTGFTEDVANAVCTAGVTMLRQRIDQAIRNLWDYDTLNLSGDSALADLDEDYDFETIEEGEAQARWTGSSGQLDFPGVFTGEAMDDDPSNHPIRERMAGLE